MNTTPTVTLSQNPSGYIDFDVNEAALALPDDEFIVLLEDSISMLKSQLLSVEQA
jgi:hypothetical protein